MALHGFVSVLRPLHVTVLGLTLAAPVTGCEPTFPDHLTSLRQDALATLELPNTEVVSSREEDARIVLSKPSPASISRRYRLQPGADPEAVWDAAVTAAEDAGWENFDPQRTVARGTKTFATGTATVEIYFLDDTQQEWIVLLEHERPVGAHMRPAARE